MIHPKRITLPYIALLRDTRGVGKQSFPPAGRRMASNHLVFFDTTLRDGEQSPGCSMTTQEKLTMAHALEDLGVDIIEAGFAMASEGDRKSVV